MKALQAVLFAAQSLRAAGARSLWILLSMAIGSAGVVLLVWVGESGRRYVEGRFAELGSSLVILLPGRVETKGAMPPTMGETARDLTLDDALSLRRLDAVVRVVPIVAGAATANREGRQREATVIGTTADFVTARRLDLAAGGFLPPGDPRRGSPYCVLGATLARELFGEGAAVGGTVRLAGQRFRVVGTLMPTGRSLGSDLDDLALIQVAAAQDLFRSEGLFRVLVEARSRDEVDAVARSCEEALAVRHDGERDVTVVTQQSVLAAFDGVLRALTLAVAGIAAIALVVAGVLILNIMVVAVTQRRVEIGLLKALGATRAEVQSLFLLEAALLAALGSGAGLLLAALVARISQRFFADLQPAAPAWSYSAAFAVALALGALAGAWPARRAAALDPVLALSRR